MNYVAKQAFFDELEKIAKSSFLAGMKKKWDALKSSSSRAPWRRLQKNPNILTKGLVYAAGVGPDIKKKPKAVFDFGKSALGGGA